MWRAAAPAFAALPFAWLAGMLAGCGNMPQAVAPAASAVQAHAAGAQLRPIGTQVLAHGTRFADTVAGGLSGLDFDGRSGQWLLASDDRGDFGPARYYTATMHIDAGTVGPLVLTGMHAWRQADGEPYARPGAGPMADVEALRIDPQDGALWYSGEGDRGLRQPSFVRRASRNGGFAAELALPPALQIQPDCACGGRSNLAIEGLSFTPDGAALWLAMEAPLIGDGEPPSLQAGGLVRFSLTDRQGRLLGQYAYPADPVPHAPAPGMLADNGVSDILAIDASRLYVLERSGAQDAGKRFHYRVRLYEATLDGASDTSRWPALAGAALRPLSKRLVLDLGVLPPAWQANYEGLAWGPRLPNGHDTLVMVSDDNFKAQEQTRFLVFEVVAPETEGSGRKQK